ncbi:RNA polymerase sigma factor [Micromonospora sp. CV4]|uniref:RNA polymerase sigma factor n=1 Tax=Micromonospora sp. CV4 TaxID=2478711 RepID=UPI001F161098|nr:RNA polymerase sigma factor [Micromonospora sp. CV4]
MANDEGYVMADRREPPSDAHLVRGIAERDRHACAELYRRYAPWLAARLGHRCADGAVIDDVIQDVFVSIWSRPPRDDVDDVAGWLWRIGYRRLVDLQRGAGLRARLQRRLFGQRLPHEPSAEDSILDALGCGEPAQALSRLPVDQQTALRVTAVDGLTMEEAARLLGVPVGTVKTRVQRARRRLRAELA